MSVSDMVELTDLDYRWSGSGLPLTSISILSSRLSVHSTSDGLFWDVGRFKWMFTR